MVRVMPAQMRARNTEREGRERVRYQVLEWLHRQVGRDCTEVVSAFGVCDDLDVPREEIFAAAEYLARRQYIDYIGAGPRICITDMGLRYLESGERRRSIR